MAKVWPTNLKESVKAAGAKVAAREFTNDKATDFAAILTKIKSKKVDVVFYGGMDAQGGPMAKQMKSLGVKAKFLTGDGGCTPEFIKLAGAASEGQYCSLPGVPLDQMPGGKTFGDAFSAKYGQIQLYAPYVYDAVMVMADAMKRANSVEPAKYLPEIGKTDYQGVTTKVQFDDKGDLKGGSISLYQGQGRPVGVPRNDRWCAGSRRCRSRERGRQRDQGTLPVKAQKPPPTRSRMLPSPSKPL